MCGAYSLPPKLGTTLPLKLCKTSSDIFNQNIINYYVNNNEIETKYYLKDPHLVDNDNACAKCVPVVVCGYLV